MSTIKTNTLQNVAGTLSVPVDTVVQGSAKAWVNFNGTGTVAIRAGFNVSSITDNGTGDYTVNFTNTMADVNYTVIAGGNGGTINDFNNVTNAPYGQVPTTSSVRIRNVDSGATVASRDLIYAYVAIFR